MYFGQDTILSCSVRNTLAVIIRKKHSVFSRLRNLFRTLSTLTIQQIRKPVNLTLNNGSFLMIGPLNGNNTQPFHIRNQTCRHVMYTVMVNAPLSEVSAAFSRMLLHYASNPHLSRDHEGMVLHTCTPESPTLPSFPGKPNSP